MMKGMDPKVQKKAAIKLLRALAADPDKVLADAAMISITIMKDLPDELRPHDEEEEEEEEIKVKKKVIKKDDDPDTDDRPPWLKKKEIEVEEEEEED